MLEKDIEIYLVRRVTDLGGMAWKLQIPGRRGAPDRLVFLPGGVMVLAELKKPKKGYLSLVQHAMREQLANLGVEVFYLRTHEAVDQLLARLARDQRALLWAPSKTEED